MKGYYLVKKWEFDETSYYDYEFFQLDKKSSLKVVHKEKLLKNTRKRKQNHLTSNWIAYIPFKGCVRYIFASLFCMSKREHLWNKEKVFFFSLRRVFRSWDNQILTFEIFKCHEVTKCLNMKHETHFTE